ncbi:sensor histidine kinase [Cohnella algarum]|uniref:sensor histidine kinase n=1 Tax=Cohnella algarum TaxID=2044859 RepID=UPI001967647D|nr:sensor histidine kinase [Cohnella algarum]MBN2984629.1 sensor histidine kinase [Cohnella algarum]
MQKWYQIFTRNTGLSPYVWVVFCILPFYFILRSSSPYEIAVGIVMIFLFFGCYMMSFVTKGWWVYFWTSIQIVISIVMTMAYGYVYFSIFLAFFIGNIQNRVGFFTLYSIHLLSTFVSVNFGIFVSKQVFLNQFPFMFVCLVAVILLPFSTYYRNKRGQLQVQLEDANKRIAELVKQEERQRIARDLHDTLGQKLSLIGLKIDLAGKLIDADPRRAQAELADVRQTARTALKEVRELVTEMRGSRLSDEIFRVKQILSAAHIEFRLTGEPYLNTISMLNENVAAMCLKEAVTNVVKHSRADICSVDIEPSPTELTIRVTDDGIGFTGKEGRARGNGLRGMAERLEFVNGSLEIISSQGNGAALIIKVPNLTRQAGAGKEDDLP